MQKVVEERSIKDYILSEEVMKELRRPVVKQQKRKKAVTKAV